MRTLPVAPAWRLAEEAPELRWLVTDLWSHDAVGIVGGEPKCCKSFLALDLAVAVAAGVTGRFLSFEINGRGTLSRAPTYLKESESVPRVIVGSGAEPNPRRQAGAQF